MSYIDLNWLKGWSDIKKPIVSNSLESLSSNDQSFVSTNIFSLSSWLDPNKSIWFDEILSCKFFDFKIIFGIESNKDFRLLLSTSNAPDFTRPSNCNLLIFLGFVLSIKLFIDLNSPFATLSLTIFAIASYPTFFKEPNE